MLTPLFVTAGLLGVAVNTTSAALTCVSGVFAALAAMDVYGRYKDFRICVERLYENNFETTQALITRYRGSHCQRQSLQLAALAARPSNPVWFRIINKKLHALGYRWYHVLPDWTTKRPSIVLTGRFWRAFMGIKK